MLGQCLPFQLQLALPNSTFSCSVEHVVFPYSIVVWETDPNGGFGQ